MQLTNGYKTFQNIGACQRIGLVEHSLVTGSGGSRLVGIYAGYYDYLLLNLLLERSETAYIINHRILAISRTGTNYQDQFVRFAAERLFDVAVILFLCVNAL